MNHENEWKTGQEVEAMSPRSSATIPSVVYAVQFLLISDILHNLTSLYMAYPTGNMLDKYVAEIWLETYGNTKGLSAGEKAGLGRRLGGATGVVRRRTVVEHLKAYKTYGESTRRRHSWR